MEDIKAAFGDIVPPSAKEVDEQFRKEMEVYSTLAEMQSPSLSFIKPAALKQRLDEYIIGNEDAKKILCTAVYNHYKRISHNGKNKETGKFIDKSNILLIGGTGSGKTYMMKTICQCLNVPFYIADASILTASGYVGQDANMVLTGLYTAAGGDISKAQQGIVIIDEIDKIRDKGKNSSVRRDVSGMDVQYELLKMMEGSIVRCNPNERKDYSAGNRHLDFDTTNVLFVCMGAFDGMEKMIERRLNVKKIGYSQPDKREQYDPDKVFSYTTADDLQKYGMLREFIGRLPIITTTETLSRKAIRDILTKPKNSIVNQYQWLFAIDGLQLSFEEEAFDIIADYSMLNKTGARSLRTTMEKILGDYMFEIPDTPHLTVTGAMVKEKLEVK